MQIQSSSYTGNTPVQTHNSATATLAPASQSYSGALMDIQSMLDKISLMFKSLRDQTQDRQVQQRSNSFTLLEGKLDKKKVANAAEAKAGYLAAGMSIGGAVVGGALGVKGIKNGTDGVMGGMSKSMLGSQLVPKMAEAGGSFAETSVRQNEVNPAKLASETIAGHQEIYDKDRERTENKADDFARQVLKTQEAINTVFREFTNAAMIK